MVVLITELHGRYGVNVQWKAVRMVIKLNWRGIIMATVAVFTANITSINALVDIYATKDQTAFLLRSLKWVTCMKTPGGTSESCEYAANNIVNLWRAWSADLLISMLGTEYFLLESSRKYCPPSPTGADLQGMVDGMARFFRLIARSCTRILSTTAVTAEFDSKSIERQRHEYAIRRERRIEGSSITPRCAG